MQQALECIERLNMRGRILADFEDEVYAAITALREALAQPVQPNEAAIRADEREACAKIAERRMLRDNNEDQKIGHHHACKSIAKDIRARGNA
jgi:hypothetical protein